MYGNKLIHKMSNDTLEFSVHVTEGNFTNTPFTVGCNSQHFSCDRLVSFETREEATEFAVEMYERFSDIYERWSHFKLVWRTYNHTEDFFVGILRHDNGQYWYHSRVGSFTVLHPIVHTDRESAIEFGIEHYEAVMQCVQRREWGNRR